MLQEALQRAEAVADRQRICTIVAQQHRIWWERPLSSMPSSNVVVQPENRGTGNGILLALLHIMERDPEARIVLLPSDHHVRDEKVLARSLKLAVGLLAARRRNVVLLGLEPEEVDPGLGYIVPGGETGDGARVVERFVEKPSDAVARELMAEGALWNAFIMVARAPTLLDLFFHRFPEIVAHMRAVVAHDACDPMEPIAATHLYRTLPQIDFSRNVLEGFESPLRVLAVPPCGWSDLGTPERVARTLRRMPVERADSDESPFPLNGQINLAAQHVLMRADG